jgi:parvulin-like peptidyl-prolyl isomerase
MTHRVKFTLRLCIYGAVFTYLICDLHYCGGPLSRRLLHAGASRPAKPATAAPGGIVARVYGYQIQRSQLERAVHERLWLEGKTLADISPQHRKLIRYAALEDLIDHELLRTKVGVNTFDLIVGEAELSDRVRRFNARFATKQELDTALASQGIAGEADLRDRLAARIQQEKYVEWRIAPLVEVTEDEARAWFAQNQQQLAIPERVEARHIFLPTLGRDADEVKLALEAALATLAAGTKDFATLARELSDDPLTKDCGGALGWMTRARLPADLAGPLFALPLHQPSLLRSKPGWHLLEVTARLPAAPRSFEQAKAEILSALTAVRRRKAAAEFRHSLRKFEAKNIEIYRDQIDE